MADGATTFSVVIPTYRRPMALSLTLQSLATLDYPEGNWELIVVDDGSNDETSTVVRSSPIARYVPQANRGAATARNTGARNARHDVLVFLDDDMLVGRDHLYEHERARNRFGDCAVNGHWEFPEAMLAQLLSTPFGRYRVGIEDWVRDRIEKRPLGDGYLEPETITACNLSIAASTFAALGGFDETFAAAGAEDQDFARRASDAGVRFVYAPSIKLEHNDGRLTFRQFCGRQRQGAASARHLASNHADLLDRPLIAENGRLRRSDPPSRLLKKAVKRSLSVPAALTVAHRVIDVLEAAAPDRRALQAAYRLMTGLYIYRGILDQE